MDELNYEKFKNEIYILSIDELYEKYRDCCIKRSIISKRIEELEGVNNPKNAAESFFIWLKPFIVYDKDGAVRKQVIYDMWKEWKIRCRCKNYANKGILQLFKEKFRVGEYLAYNKDGKRFRAFRGIRLEGYNDKPR